MKTPRWLAFSLLLVVCVAAAPVRAQSSAVEPAGGETPAAADAAPESAAPIRLDYMETVEVDLLQLNFLATDRDGKPILDLTPDDLEVKINGKRARIGFLERNATLPAANAPATQLATEPAQPVQESPAAGSPTDPQARRWIVLFFDRNTTSMRTRHAALDAATRWINDGLRENDRVAIATYERKLNFVQSFTSDPSEIAMALARVGKSDGVTPPDRPGTIKSLVNSIEHCKAKGPMIGVRCAENYIRPYENDLVRERRSILSSLTLVVRSMATIPDIKTVLFFSDGFAHNPSADGVNVVDALLGFDARTRMNPSYRPEHDLDYRTLAEAASLAKTTIFTIFPGGANDMGMISASQRMMVDERTGTQVTDYYARSAQNFEYGLADVALRTGGLATTRANALGALNDMLHAAEGLYTVGLYTAGVSAYRDYDVKIESKREGVRLSVKREIPRLRRTTPLAGALEIDPAECTSDGRRPMSLKVTLDARTLQFVRAEKQRNANFAVFVMVYDAAGNKKLYEQFRLLNVAVPDSDIEGEVNPAVAPSLQERLVVPCRPLTIVVSVSDAESGARGRFVHAIE